MTEINDRELKPMLEELPKLIDLSEIHEVHINGVFANEGGLGFVIGWSGDKGFGEITIQEHTKNDMFFEVDSENMSKQFVRKVLLSLLDGVEWGSWDE